MIDFSSWTQQMIADAQERVDASPSPDGDPEVVEQEVGDEVATGPLSQMLIDNAPLIDAAISAYGPASVAAFFINTGTGIASIYEVDDIHTRLDKSAHEQES